MLRKFGAFMCSAALLTVLLPYPGVDAAEIPFSVRQAVVRTRCGNRQGSGVVINPEKGYVLTNAHILLDLDDMIPAKNCEVAFIDGPDLVPRIFYHATGERYSYDESQNHDFAILRIGPPKTDATLSAFPYLKTDEFSEAGDPMSVIAFPSSAGGKQSVTTGSIKALTRGIIKTDSEISPGSSGGAGVDAHNNLIGIATRILLREVSPGVEEVVDYELVDLRAILNWLDTFGDDAHDQYVTHADHERYHGPAAFFTPKNLSCTLLAKVADSTTVYCLRANGTRSVFPNDATYQTWFAGFDGVLTIPVEQLAAYRLATNVTMKPGTLVKIQTDPKVYLVSNVDGGLRWIKNEERAKELYGEGWAGFVKDVPVTFFTNYTIGAPVE